MALSFAEALIKAGADIIVLAEPSASLLSPLAYYEFSQNYVEGTIRALNRPCILHNSLLLNATPEEVKDQTTDLLESVEDRKEFFALPGCDLAPATPLENILAFARTVKQYS